MKGPEMPTIVTADELRQVLGVSESLFSDAYLDSIIESAEITILPMLTQYQSAVISTRVVDDVLYIDTLRPNYFVEGQGIVLAGIGGGLDGPYTEIYASVPAVNKAILIVSVEIFQSITAPGGQIEGVDFAPTPYRMGRSLQNRVIGLISAFYDVDSICQ
jgi:hypothetical protein